MSKTSHNGLVRALSLSALIIYGVGDILGAGIYAIIGKIAGHAGPYTWLAFAIALFIILFTALSYSELGSRYPRSGGVSVFIHEAFGNRWFSIFVGFLLFSATLLSMATLSQAFAGYVDVFGWSISNTFSVLIFLCILMLINLRGIKQSSIANIISTMIEVSGLIIVIVCGISYLLSSQPSIMTQSNITVSMYDILQGTALAFFAFTGFEDLANVAEEVKHPHKNLPRAILSALGLAGILYLSVSWLSTTIIPGVELSQSSAPLLSVVKKAYPTFPTYLFTAIAIFAVANTTLLNYITASRLLYGMAQDKLLPGFFEKVHRRYHTPYIAILIIFPIVLLLAIFGSLKGLAGSTSAVVLVVFSLSSIALIAIKWRERKQRKKEAHFTIPLLVPCLAVMLNLFAITFLPMGNLLLAAGFIVLGLIVSALIRIFERKSFKYNISY